MINSLSISAFVTVIIYLLLGSGVDQVLGRKCVCTVKACKESGTKTCRTRYSCYTELVYSGEVREPGTTIKTIRGCIEGPASLLCETKSWSSNNEEGLSSLEMLGRAAWPRLTCCDSDDYCNAADEDFESTGGPDERPLEVRDNDNTTDTWAERTPARVYPVLGKSTRSGGAGGQSVQQLHVAALVLAIAGLISVFAAYYVVTRFVARDVQQRVMLAF